MRQESSKNGSDAGQHTATDGAGRKAWHAPRLKVIDIEGAEASVTFASDGLYAVS